ncbi:MAG: TlpA disulfide reductase family protein [Nitrospirota bacterium]
MNTKTITLLLLLIVGVAGVVLLSRTEEKPRATTAVKGLDAPAFELKDTTGKVWKLSDLKGKVVLVNFWATWCDTCKEEKPSLVNLINSEKGNDKFVFVSVLFRDDPAKVPAYMREYGYSFPVLIDDKNIAKAYGLTGVPESFLIDKNGILREKVIGPMQWDTPEVKAVIAKLIGE